MCSSSSCYNVEQATITQLKRTFILLREDDHLRAPKPNTLKNLKDSGRVKDLDFSNNATSQHVREIIQNNFSTFLSNDNISR